MCIGLDRFKDVNDTLGHLAGDQLIRLNAERIGSMIRSGDTLARRVGDEFVVIQTDTDGLSSAALAKRVLEGLTGTVNLESGQVFSSCSIGVTLIHDADIDPAEALRQADLALYRAKDQGRGQYAFFEVEMDATIKLRKTLETGLREAIHVDDITVVYQPQVDHLGNIVGVEAPLPMDTPDAWPGLARLLHTAGRRMRPDVRTGDAGDAQGHDRRPALARYEGGDHRLRDATAPRRFPEERTRPAHGTGTNASQIEIEITEGVLLNDDHSTQLVLRDLRNMGFSIALDDFGTGYSSLGYLSRYPVDKIKIDRSFVSNLGVDPEAEAVIRAIVKLSKALNLNIVAEGVETRAQKNILRNTGCNIIQGFIFSRPVPVEDIDAMMHSGCRLTINEVQPA